MPRFSDTIVALATPAGTAALAVLRVSGPDTRRLARELWRREPRPRLATHRDFRSLTGALLDDVVLTFFEGPKSYTGEDALEISSHGNPYVAQRIMEDLRARGCRLAEPGEFTQRAFLNGRMDLSQAEAVMDIIHARSERALAMAQQQLRGALGRRLNALVDALLGVIARVEAYIDFPDEDLPAEDRSFLRSEITRLHHETGQLLATRHYGELLREGIRTVIVGEPNVGKSSLLNRLVGWERALVSPEPGTTRDFIEERIMLGPHCLRLIDTAGLNPSPAPLERLGMEKTRECLASADLVLCVLDGSVRNASLPAEINELPAERTVYILNKSDLGVFEPSPGPMLPVSAKTGSGIPQLIDAIVQWADRQATEIGEESIAINARHSLALDEARVALTASLDLLDQKTSPELVASELRRALGALGEIVGRVDNERMLDQLFASFCIGK